jgi:hypothetical protein
MRSARRSSTSSTPAAHRGAARYSTKPLVLVPSSKALRNRASSVLSSALIIEAAVSNLRNDAGSRSMCSTMISIRASVLFDRR